MLGVYARPLRRCERLIPLVEKKTFGRVESDSAKSAKFSIVRKLCQPGVYVLVCVVASLYVIVVIVFMTCT